MIVDSHRTGVIARRWLLGYAVLAASGSPLDGQQPPDRLAAFLRQPIGLEASLFASLERGDPIVKVLGTDNQRDVAVFGIVRVDVPRGFYVSRLEDFPNSLRTPTRARFGVFQIPANPADVAAVTVAVQEVTELKNCRPGSCKIKMPGTDMQRLLTEIDWSAASPETQVNDYVRRRLLEYATDYRARGDSAMVVYDDRGRVRASDAFAALLAESPYLYQDFPSLRQYLASYPHADHVDAREVLFWAIDSVQGLRPILSVTHLVSYRPSEDPGVSLVVAKQIYANHYFEGALDATAVVDRVNPGEAPGIYLVRLRRFQFDNLPSGPVVSLRGKVVGRLRDQTRDDLARLKLTSERALGSQPGPH